MASVLDISGRYARNLDYQYRAIDSKPSYLKSDKEAISSDWATIGLDIRKAIGAFQEYEDILPESMDKILSMTEIETQHLREIEKRDQEHKIKMEEEEIEMKKAVIKSDARRANLGLVTGLIIAIIGLGGSIYLGINDKVAASAIIGCGTITGLVAVFVTGNKRQRS
ncbi:hypothetical protein [Crocosphaera sp.]|uniref:hypothetical protein n=1 Tax=Crocosphaera sp. TaxID=2729996 RepID=UPI00261CBD9B|nr:hypothetical protein [Crocosphaera sp.]